MTERETLPCPGCGIGEFYDHELGRFCNHCGLTADPEVWNRLSRAAALLRDVETIDACLQRNGSLALNVFADWTGITIECLTDGVYVDQRTRPTLGAALAALAGEVSDDRA